MGNHHKHHKHHNASTDPLVPQDTPFAYNAGVNYESWEYGRTGYSIAADLNQIYKNFHLIRTYHDAAVGTDDPTTPTIDSTQAEVIDWIVSHPGAELVMGTNNNALAAGGYGSPWSAGLMVSSTYTDAWVQMIIDAFGSVAKVKVGLKAILLGNEVDANGPPPTDGSFDDYVNTWIPAAFDNLKASLAAAGLGSIPISTTIANYGPTNLVSVKIPAHIVANWGAAWNNGKPFVMFNQYTQDNMESTNYKPVETYFEGVETALGSGLEVFVGETGYSSYWGEPNQGKVYKQIFSWLGGQYKDGGKTVPLFAFDAFDRPTALPAQEVDFGIYNENSSHKPTGLKANVTIPAWTSKSITSSTNKSEALYGGDGADTIRAKDGDDIVLGMGGSDRLHGEWGFDMILGYRGHDLLRGGRGDDYLDGGLGDDTLSGGRGENELRGGGGEDIFVFTVDGTAHVLDFENGTDRFGLKGDHRFGKLSFHHVGDDTEIRSGSDVIAVVHNSDPTIFGKDDFFHM